MRIAFIVLAGLAASGCEISPVVSAPLESPGVRYSDCSRAATQYCEDAIEAPAREMDACIAEYRFKCVSSSGRPSGVSRS